MNPVSARRTNSQLIDALAYVESILDTVREPMLVLDGTLHVISASHSFLRTFGVSREESEGKFIYDLGNGQWDIPALRTLLEKLLPKSTILHDFEVIHDFPGLGRRVMLLNARKLWNEADDIDLVLLAFEDVTERRRLEEELLRSNEDLQRFAYVAAHDLRSPVKSTVRLLQLYARRVKGKLDEGQDLLTASINSLLRLDTLMSDILTYSQTSHATCPKLLLSLRTSLDIALANLQHDLAESHAAVTVEVLPEVFADRTQMAIVLQNLIGNAIKYRGRETPRINLSAALEDNNWRIAVRDNGEGIAPEFALRIFEPFKRLHGADIPGSGIGLATCKRIVERNGGRLWAESVVGQGSTFYFTIPMGEMTPAAAV